VAIKAGASEQARTAALSHTGALAGSDAGARALLERLGIARVETLSPDAGDAEAPACGRAARVSPDRVDVLFRR
jgi:acyl-CoA synthetase (NDP forming)